MKHNQRFHPSHWRRFALAVATFFLATVALLWAWNAVLPPVFGLVEIQFKQALGLMILGGLASLVLRGGRRHEHQPA
ncbi:MAG: hypothetical protein LJE84_10625 [Gammaproteobacteria bacterium]|jgi:nucleoside permease NupC|nr:hypothetical protein [Gammaproteobacteria bacterium]